MAQLCNNSMMEGLILRELDILHDGAIKVNQNYTIVGFDLHISGGQGGEINEPWKMPEECLKHCGKVLIHSFGFSCVGDGALTLLVRDAQQTGFYTPLISMVLRCFSPLFLFV